MIVERAEPRGDSGWATKRKEDKERQQWCLENLGRKNVAHHFNLAASTTSAYNQTVWRRSQAL